MTLSECRIVIHFLVREIDFLRVFRSALGPKILLVQCLIWARSPEFERHEHHHSAIRSGELKMPGFVLPSSTLFHIAHLRQVSQHNSVTTQQCHNTTVSQHNSVTTQQCHNTTVSQHNSVTTQHCHNTKVSQLKSSDFSGGTFKSFEVL